MSRGEVKERAKTERIERQGVLDDKTATLAHRVALSILTSFHSHETATRLDPIPRHGETRSGQTPARPRGTWAMSGLDRAVKQVGCRNDEC